MTGTATVTSPVAEPIDPIVIDPAVADPVANEAVIDANPADPSTVDPDANEPKSLLDVVTSAVQKPEVAVASSDPEGDPVVPPVADAVEADAKTENDADLPFHNHPRWKAVIAERDSFKEPAERWGQIDGFMREHNLSGEEVAEGYQVMALLKSSEPDKLSVARDWFSDRLDALNQMLGHTLPVDLQQRIDDGLLDEAGAQELAQARAAAALREQQAATRTEAEIATERQQTIDANVTSMVSAVEEWEARVKAADADYSKKADLVQAKCAAIVQREGKAPTNATEAAALAERAYAEVNALMKSALPKPRSITPAPAGQSTVAVAQPKSLRDAISASLS